MSLIDKHDVPLEKIMFIGHSLGAHVCGFAAKRIQDSNYGVIPRFFAADPAAPLFAGNQCQNRVCITDAKRLIVLHTSVLGIETAIGHVDLYMNKGLIQPGCERNLLLSY
jgi:surfactin synthase thioesterase subunit